MNYYEHHIGDYAQATLHLSLLEDAVLGRMLRRYYADEKPLPADIAMVQRLVGARAPEEREAVETVLREFFTLTDDGWRNKRCDAEIAKYLEKQDKAKRSANARWKAEAPQAIAKPTQSDPDATAMRTQCDRIANALPTQCSPDTRHQSPEEIAPSELVGTVVPDPWRCPPCPHEEIVRLYGELLPQLPRCIALNDTRRSHIGARWRQVCVDAKFSRAEGLDWFRDFFADVGRSKFLTGNGTAGKDGRVWRADLDWLMNQTNFLKVFEGRYHPERATA